MEANKILNADVLDILFEGRNKEYGAYELRKKYNKRILMAMLITVGIVVAAIGAALLANEVVPKAKDVQMQDVTLAQIEEPPPPPDLPPPPPPKAPEPPPVELTKFTPPVIKKDEEVQKQEMPPQEELPDTKIAEITQEGIKDLNITIPPVVEESKGTVQGPVFDENEIFQKVEIEAKVDARQWRRHLESQLQRYIEDAAAQGMPPGQYTVHVRFLVERDGSVADVSVVGSDPGYGLGKGAVQVVKRGPKWSPGEQNGRKVRSYHTQPITFVIAEE